MSTTTSKEKFSKILVPIDGSEPSMDAADDAILMARQYNGFLLFLLQCKKEGIQPINAPPLHVIGLFFFQCIGPFGKGIPITKLGKTATWV